MTSNITQRDDSQPSDAPVPDLFRDWFDPIESGLRERAREFIQALMESELEAALARPRYGRRAKEMPSDGDGTGLNGHRHGHRSRTLLGSFGRLQVWVPRARIKGEDGRTSEWRSRSLGAYQRRTRKADALIASAYLAGTNTRRVCRALGTLFAGAIGKDTVSRVWRKVKETGTPGMPARWRRSR
jgi:putative transposase